MTSIFDLHTIIWGLIVITSVIWFLGMVGSGRKRFIHLLLVMTIVMIIYNFFLH
ncbi:MAG TPA: DUF5670 family protein [Ktedonobacteraceae bacterium]